VYANFTYGKKEKDSVAEFKERNAFQKMDLPRYYVPMTLAGRIGFRLGLHHKLADQIPPSVVAKIRNLRNAWNNRKLQSATEAS
jgi:hypothetical protein